MKLLYVIIVLLVMRSGCFAQTGTPSGIIAAEQKLREACISHNGEKMREHALELASYTAYSAEQLEYAINLLLSVEQNGILITGGKGDTYPLMTLQYVRAMRPDVSLVQASWLENPDYAQWIQQSYGLQGSPIEMIRQWSKTHPVYISLAAPSAWIDTLDDQLYCTGLAFKYSEVPLANVKLLYGSWWKNCLKDHIYSGYALNANYLMPLALIVSYAKDIRRKTEAKEIKGIYSRIAKSVGAKEQLPLN